LHLVVDDHYSWSLHHHVDALCAGTARASYGSHLRERHRIAPAGTSASPLLLAIRAGHDAPSGFLCSPLLRYL
jgi:hypothetical protein